MAKWFIMGLVYYTSARDKVGTFSTIFRSYRTIRTLWILWIFTNFLILIFKLVQNYIKLLSNILLGVSKIFISSSFSFDMIVDAPHNARNHIIDDLSAF